MLALPREVRHVGVHRVPALRRNHTTRRDWRHRIRCRCRTHCHSGDDGHAGHRAEQHLLETSQVVLLSCLDTPSCHRRRRRPTPSHARPERSPSARPFDVAAPPAAALPATRTAGHTGGRTSHRMAALTRVDAMDRVTGRCRAVLVPMTPGRGQAHASTGDEDASHQGAMIHDSRGPRQWAFRLKPDPLEPVGICRPFLGLDPVTSWVFRVGPRWALDLSATLCRRGLRTHAGPLRRPRDWPRRASRGCSRRGS